MGFMSCITRKPLATSEYQKVGPSLWMRLPAEVRANDTPRPGTNLVYKIGLGSSGRIEIDHIGLESNGGTVITSSDWRAANPFETWREVGLWLIKERHEIEGGVRYSAPEELSVEVAANLRSRGPSNGRTLEVVAQAYNVAQALGIPVSKHVQRVFSANGKLDPLPRATASGWIRRAKDQGLIKGDDA